MILNKIKEIFSNIRETYKAELLKIQIKDAEAKVKRDDEFVCKHFDEKKVLEAMKSYVERQTVPVEIPCYELIIASPSGSAIEIHAMDCIDLKVLKVIREQIKNGYKFYITPTNGMVAEAMQNAAWVKINIQLDASPKTAIKHIHLE